MSATSGKSFKSRAALTSFALFAFFMPLFTQGCSDMNTLIWNKAETTIDGHRVVIRSCRNSYTRTEYDAKENRRHIFGCANYVKVEIGNEELTVNGKSYGTLGRGDSVEVKGGKVLVNNKEAGAVAMK